jgi:hypothetical protein
VSGQLHAPAALPPGKSPRYPLYRRLFPPVPFGEEVGWTPELVWTTWRRKNSSSYRDSNSESSVAQPVFVLFGLGGYWHCGHSWPIVPASGDSEDDCGEVDGRGNQSSRRTPAPAPLLSITKSHMTRPGFEPQAAALGSRRLTARAIARPY